MAKKIDPNKKYIKTELGKRLFDYNGETPSSSMEFVRNSSSPADQIFKTKDITPDYMGGVSAVGNYYDYSSSKYDGSIYSHQLNDLEDIRSQNQGVLSSLGNSTANFLGKTAVNTVGGLVGFIYGAGSAIGTGNISALMDNDVTTALDNASDSIGEMFKVYKSSDYNDKFILNKMVSNPLMFTDEFMDTLSFTAGAIITELVSGGLASATVLPKATKYLNALMKTSKSLDTVADISKVASGIEKAAGVANLASGLERAGKLSRQLATGAFWESSVEARQLGKEMQNKMTSDYINEMAEKGIEIDPNNLPPDVQEDIDNRVRNASMATMALNMGLVGFSNISQFPTIFKSMDTAKRGALKEAAKDVVSESVEGVTKYSSRLANLSKTDRNLLRTWAAVKNPFMEGFVEEGGQSVISKTFSSFYDRKNDIDGGSEAEKFASSFSKAFLDTYATKEGLNEVLMGALVGGVGSPGAGVLSVLGKDTAMGRHGFTKSVDAEGNEKFTRKPIWDGGMIGGIREFNERANEAQLLADSLNSENNDLLIKGLKENYEAQVRNYNLNKDLDDAIDNNDHFAFQNAKDNILFNFVHNRLQAGLRDDLDFKVSELENMSPEDFYVTFKGEDAANKASKKEMQEFQNDSIENFNRNIEAVAKADNTVNSFMQDLPQSDFLDAVALDLKYYLAKAEMMSTRRDDIYNQLTKLTKNLIVDNKNIGLTVKDAIAEQTKSAKQDPDNEWTRKNLIKLAGFKKQFGDKLPASVSNGLYKFMDEYPSEFTANKSKIEGMLADLPKIEAYRGNLIKLYDTITKGRNILKYTDYLTKLDKQRQSDAEKNEKDIETTAEEVEAKKIEEAAKNAAVEATKNPTQTLPEINNTIKNNAVTEGAVDTEGVNDTFNNSSTKETDDYINEFNEYLKIDPKLEDKLMEGTSGILRTNKGIIDHKVRIYTAYRNSRTNLADIGTERDLTDYKYYKDNIYGKESIPNSWVNSINNNLNENTKVSSQVNSQELTVQEKIDDIERRRQEELLKSKEKTAQSLNISKFLSVDLSGYVNIGESLTEEERARRLSDDIEVFVENYDSKTDEDYKNFLKTQGHTLFAFVYRKDLEALKEGVNLYKALKKDTPLRDKINAKYDTELEALNGDINENSEISTVSNTEKSVQQQKIENTNNIIRFNKDFGIKINNGIEFYNNKGNRITNIKKISSLSSLLFKNKGLFKSIFETYLSDNTLEDINNYFEKTLQLFNNGSIDDNSYLGSPELLISEILLGTKFTEKGIKDNLSDISNKWFGKAEDGVKSLDYFVANELYPNRENYGLNNLDQQEITDLVLDIISNNPKGITKKSLQNLRDSLNPNKPLEDLRNEFLNKFGLNLEEIIDFIANEKTNTSEGPPVIEQNEREFTENYGENVDTRSALDIDIAELEEKNTKKINEDKIIVEKQVSNLDNLPENPVNATPDNQNPQTLDVNDEFLDQYRGTSLTNIHAKKSTVNGELTLIREEGKFVSLDTYPKSALLPNLALPGSKVIVRVATQSEYEDYTGKNDYNELTDNSETLPLIALQDNKFLGFILTPRGAQSSSKDRISKDDLTKLKSMREYLKINSGDFISLNVLDKSNGEVTYRKDTDGKSMYRPIKEHLSKDGKRLADDVHIVLDINGVLHSHKGKNFDGNIINPSYGNGLVYTLVPLPSGKHVKIPLRLSSVNDTDANTVIEMIKYFTAHKNNPNDVGYVSDRNNLQLTTGINLSNINDFYNSLASILYVNNNGTNQFFTRVKEDDGYYYDIKSPRGQVFRFKQTQMYEPALQDALREFIKTNFYRGINVKNMNASSYQHLTLKNGRLTSDKYDNYINYIIDNDILLSDVYGEAIDNVTNKMSFALAPFIKIEYPTVGNYNLIQAATAQRDTGVNTEVLPSTTTNDSILNSLNEEDDFDINFSLMDLNNSVNDIISPDIETEIDNFIRYCK